MKAGYGKSKITPPLGTPCSMGINDELVEVFDDIYIRAIWIKAGGDQVLIASADVIALYPSDCDDFMEAIRAATGIPAGKIILHGTHTHQAPNARWEIAKILEPYGLSDEHSSPVFGSIMKNGFVEAAKQAVNEAEEARMSYAEVPVDRVASARRIPVDDGTVIVRWTRPSADLRDLPEGYIDPLLRTVFFKTEKSGKLIGVCNYNCHPASTGGDEGPYVTGDFPGVGMTIAEGKMDGLQLLHLTGTCGEIATGKYVSSDSLEPEERKKDARILGERYADAILRAVDIVCQKNDWAPVDSLKLLKKRPIGLTVRDDLLSEAEYADALKKEVMDYLDKKEKGTEIPGIYAYGELAYNIANTLWWYNIRLNVQNGKLLTQASAMKLGNLLFTFLPGEIFLQFGDVLREKFKDQKLINVEMCFDQNVCYVVPPECFTEGGYEPTGTKLAAEAYGELLVEMAQLLNECK